MVLTVDRRGRRGHAEVTWKATEIDVLRTAAKIESEGPATLRRQMEPAGDRTGGSVG